MTGPAPASPCPQAVPKNPSLLHGRLLRWYDANRRRLPWRERPSPYRAWISEIMLQQTQVAAALPYYERFLRRFPDVRSLARSRETEVLKLWAGLGYYRRARDLRRAARRIVALHDGRFPDSLEAALELPGVGRYTAGAVLSTAFNRPLPALDGNVARVFARLFGIHGDVKDSRVRKDLWSLALRLARAPRPGDWNQALMELGALVCLPRSPRCPRCPLERRCVARRNGLQDRLPRTRPRKAAVRLRWTCLWIEKDGKVLLFKRPGSERFLPGHWGLPEARHLKAAKPSALLATVRHAITNHRITVELRRAAPAPGKPSRGFRWTAKSQAGEFLVSSLWAKAFAAGAARSLAQRNEAQPSGLQARAA